MNSFKLHQVKVPGLLPLKMGVLCFAALSSFFLPWILAVSLWSLPKFQHLYYHVAGGSSVHLCTVQRNICQGLKYITRTSSPALASCFDFPQTCFITTNLSGSHWALGWPLVRRPALLGYQGTVSLSVRTLSLPACLAATLCSQPFFSHEAALAVSHFVCFGPLICQLPWMPFGCCHGKDSDKSTPLPLHGILQPNF